MNNKATAAVGDDGVCHSQQWRSKVETTRKRELGYRQAVNVRSEDKTYF